MRDALVRGATAYLIAGLLLARIGFGLGSGLGFGFGSGFGLGIAHAAPPAVAPPHEGLARAAAAWKELEYDAVVAAADLALASELSVDERCEALRWRGSALAVLGRPDEATATFRQIFALAPDYQLPDDTSPRILAIYRPARAAWQVAEQERLQGELGRKLAAMRLAVDVPQRARGGLPIPISMTLTDPARLAEEIIVGFRRGGSAHYASLSLPGTDGRAQLSIPGATTASPTDYTLDLFVRVRHRSGATLVGWGSADEPQHLAVQKGQVPTQRRLVKQWWLWTGATLLAGSLIAIPFIVNRAVDVGPQTVRFTR